MKVVARVLKEEILDIEPELVIDVNQVTYRNRLYSSSTGIEIHAEVGSNDTLAPGKYALVKVEE